MRKRVLLAVLVVLLMGGAAGVYLLALSREGMETHGEFECAEDLTGVEVSAVVTVDASWRDTARLTSRVELTMPADHPLAWAFLEHGDDSDFRGIVRCFFGLNLNDIRAEPPAVSVADGRLRVVDEVYNHLVPSPGLTQIGVVEVAVSTDSQEWLATLMPTDALKAAKWTKFTVVAPPGWLGSPQPQPPVSRGDTELVWVQPGSVSWVVVPDVATTVAGSSYRPPFSIGWAVLRWSVGVAILIATVMCLRRIPSSHPEVVDAGRAARRLAPPLYVLFGYAVVNDIAMELLKPVPEHMWGILAALEVVLVTAIVVGYAVWWRAGVVMSAVLGLCASGLLALLVVAQFEQWMWLVADGPVRVTVKAAISLLIATILATGFAQAVRGAVRVDDSRWVGVVPWVLGAVVALVLVYDRLLGNVLSAARYLYFSPEPLNARNVCCAHEFFPDYAVDALVSTGATVLLPGALCAVLMRYVDRTDKPDRRWLGFAAGLLFFVGSIPRSVYLWGWEIPVWLLFGAVCLLVFPRLRSPLDRTVDGTTVRDIVRALDPEHLRQQAREWPFHLQRARTAEEEAFARGARGEQTARVEPSGGLLTRLTAKWRAQEPVTFPLAGLSPVDVLLSLGPGPRIRDNVRMAVRCVLWTGLPLGLGLHIWQWVAARSVTEQPLWFVVDLATVLLWESVKWLVTGLLVGLLWRWLPGRRGPVKVLPLAAVYTVSTLTSILLRVGAGHSGWDGDLRDATIYLAVLTVIGLMMDVAVLRELKAPWSRPWQAFRQAYGVQNLSGQLTFVLAQVAAALAIVAYMLGSPEAPAYPSVDPFQFERIPDGSHP